MHARERSSVQSSWTPSPSSSCRRSTLTNSRRGTTTVQPHDPAAPSHELDARKEQIPAIRDALFEKAQRGDVPAAWELRGWFDQGLGRPGDASLDTGDVDRPFQDMTPEERVRLRAVVIRRISEAEAALKDDEQAKA